MSGRAPLMQPSAVWESVVEYAREPIADLTEVCVTTTSTDAEIRAAQAAIAELERLIALPKVIAAEAQMRVPAGARKEY